MSFFPHLSNLLALPPFFKLKTTFFLSELNSSYIKDDH